MDAELIADSGLRAHFNDDGLHFTYRGEHVSVQPWGEGLRVRSAMCGRSTVMGDALPANWALLPLQDAADGKTHVSVFDRSPECCGIENGGIRCEVSSHGILSFFSGDRLLLRECFRDEGAISNESSCLKRPAREWKGIAGASEYSLRVSFESDPAERIFGMGQYQQRSLNHKGAILDLEQRNSQVSVPFALSSRGYGFLWNNPAVGKAVFGANRTEWTASSTRRMDYWICAGDTPAEIIERYTAVTGRAGGFPEEYLGLWQCKLRYRTQAEVMEVARQYRDRGIQLSCIIVDFFHWTAQGDYDFDRRYWPDPAAMVQELHQMGIKVLVSVWPSVDMRSKNWDLVSNEGWLLRWDNGYPITYTYEGQCGTLDLFNADTRRWFEETCLGRYLEYGFDGFWLDNCEPDLERYDFQSLRYGAGPAAEISCMYGQAMSQCGHAALEKAADSDESRSSSTVNLVRSGWAGSQRLSNVFWSGDVPSTFEAFADQVQCGINMGLAGIPWWTTDIGGFLTPDSRTEEFHELLVRWFQYAVYTPVLRMHGNRGPFDIPPLDDIEPGGGYLFTGHPNELWSYGPSTYRLLHAQLNQRMALREYISDLFKEASATGLPLIRAMFVEFPGDDTCWEVQDQYMFGPKYLVAPVTALGQRERAAYLPAGSWRLTSTGQVLSGGCAVHVAAPLEYIPVFERGE